MNMQEAIKAVTERRNLSSEDMTAIMRTIMTGEATQAQIGGFLIGLRMKGETVEEIAAAAVFLASPHAENITGQALNIDGGTLTAGNNSSINSNTTLNINSGGELELAGTVFLRSM